MAGGERCYALSLTQCWASLVVIGEKRFETRSRSFGYRGTLAIHASKGFPRDCRERSLTDPFLWALRKHGIDPHALPLGCVIGKVEVRAYHPTNSIPTWNEHAAAHEHEFGDYGPGRFAWELHNPMRLVTPIPAKGALGLWAFTFPADAQWMDYVSGTRPEMEPPFPDDGQCGNLWRKHGVLSSEIEHGDDE